MGLPRDGRARGRTPRGGKSIRRAVDHTGSRNLLERDGAEEKKRVGGIRCSGRGRRRPSRKADVPKGQGKGIGLCRASLGPGEGKFPEGKTDVNSATGSLECQ